MSVSIQRRGGARSVERGSVPCFRQNFRWRGEGAGTNGERNRVRKRKNLIENLVRHRDGGSHHFILGEKDVMARTRRPGVRVSDVPNAGLKQFIVISTFANGRVKSKIYKIRTTSAVVLRSSFLATSARC